MTVQAAAYAPWFHEAIDTGIDFAKLHTSLQAGVDRILHHPRYDPAAHVWLTGSGDSVFAAQIALPALQRWTGFNGSVVAAIEFSRYRVPLLSEADSLWAISNSGSAARTRETVALAKAKGVFTVGITGSDTGPLATTADVFLYRPVEELTGIPERNRGIFMNMNEFLVTLYTLFFTGLTLGVANSKVNQAECDRILAACEAAIRSVGPTAASLEPSAQDLATQLLGLDTLWTIGAGPSFGTARYCAAKFHEQLPINGIAEDLEEWAHLQYFLTLTWKQRSVVFVLAPPGNSLDRAEELVEGIRGVGGRAIVVAHVDHGSFPEALCEFRLAGETDEFLAGFTYHLPAQLLILHLSSMAGVDPYALRRADDYNLIRHGIVRNDPESLR